MSAVKITMFFIFLITLFGIAFAVPGIPHQFFGTVTINGTPADNASIVAKINNVQVASTVSVNGTYGFYPNIFYVPDPNSTNTGKTIKFYLNGNYLDYADTVFETGASTQLDLFYGTAPSCGDGQCNASETCSSCVADCGTCPPVTPPSGGGGGGDSGGGGGGGGSAGGSLIIQAIGKCVSEPISIGVVNINYNPVAGAEIEVVHNRTSVAKKIANADGNATFTFEEEGKYEFVARSGMAVSALKIVTLETCENTPEPLPETQEQKDLCENKNCNDNNPCTTDSCNKGFCTYEQLSGISCGGNKTCQAGECLEPAPIEEPSAPAGPATGFFGLETGIGNILLGLLIIIALGWFGYSYQTRMRKK